MKSLRRAAAVAVMSACLIFAGAPSHAQSKNTPSAAELVAAFRTLWSDEKYVAAYVRKNIPVFTPPQAALYTKYLIGLLTHEAVLRRMADVAVSAAKAGYTKEQMSDYFVEVGTTWQVKGIARLNNDDIEFFLRQVGTLMDHLAPEDCKRMVMGTVATKEIQSLEHAWMSTLGEGDFKALLEFNRRSYLAEVGDYPSVRTVNAKQRELYVPVMEKQARARWSRLPDPTSPYRVFGNMAASDPNELCMAAKENLMAHLDLAEPLRTWALVDFAVNAGR